MVDRPAQEISRDRVYTDEEIKILWKGFDQCWVAGEIFKMCLVTGQRLSEVKGMRLSEIQDDIWTIPNTRTKNSRTHTVPLSRLAIDLLKEAKGNNANWVYPSPKGLASVISDHTI